MIKYFLSETMQQLLGQKFQNATAFARLQHSFQCNFTHIYI